mgnify:CR=1 FL=1
MAAASSLVPVPGVDLVTDLALLTRLIGRINDHFGLSEAQLARLSPARQALAYRLLTGAGLSPEAQEGTGWLSQVYRQVVRGEDREAAPDADTRAHLGATMVRLKKRLPPA